MKSITTHHDGFELAAAIKLEAIDEPGPGGANHEYAAHVVLSKEVPVVVAFDVLRVRYQRGPRNEPGSMPGVIDTVLLAIVQDRLKAFQAGPFACAENAEAADHVRQAMDWLKARATSRARRGVLGTDKP